MIDAAKAVGKSINTLARISPSAAGKLALNVFCRPNEGKNYSEKETEFLAKSNWKTVKLDGEDIQCYIWGEGTKKVLLMHGFNSNATRWRPLIGLMQNADYQIIALDAPAHGKSGFSRVNGVLYARTLEAVMAEFRPEYIVGHSFAGIAIAYYFTQMDYLPVQKIVLMGVPDELMEITNVFFKTLALNSSAKRAYFQAFDNKFGYDVDYFTLSNLVQKIPIEGLVIHDEQDDIASFSGAQKIAKNWKNAAFFSTKGLGHSLQGRSVYKAILNFFNNNPSSGQ